MLCELPVLDAGVFDFVFFFVVAFPGAGGTAGGGVPAWAQDSA